MDKFNSNNVKEHFGNGDICQSLIFGLNHLLILMTPIQTFLKSSFSKVNVLKLNTVYTVYINLTHFYIQSHAPAPPPWHSQKKDINFESIKLQKNPNWFTIHIILLEMKIFSPSGIAQTSIPLAFIKWENYLLLQDSILSISL